MSDTVEAVIRQTEKTLWEVKNVISCVPDKLWDKPFAGAPIYIHIYHMLHSLDRWFINPYDDSYTEPVFHVPGLNDIDAAPDVFLSRALLAGYLDDVEKKILSYVRSLTDALAQEKPKDSPYSRLELILGQLRHLYAHVGMLMGWIIAFDGRWPLTLGMERQIPEEGDMPFFA